MGDEKSQTGTDRRVGNRRKKQIEIGFDDRRKTDRRSGADRRKSARKSTERK